MVMIILDAMMKGSAQSRPQNIKNYLSDISRKEYGKMRSNEAKSNKHEMTPGFSF